MSTNDKFFIPRELHVGYQDRSEAYTGKLAYVIYVDQTGKLRKEKSWESWRSKKYNPDVFENVPTEGFVLNKRAGGYKSGWNYRQSYCRVYDPRGFEFEITIDNLLWILEWEDCMHGKGLSGKFVYGWIYDQLYLIPCATEDYRESKKSSDNIFESVNMDKSELIVGSSYKVKNRDNAMVFVGNLKVQNKLGKGYKSQLFFYEINTSKYEHSSDDELIRIDKSSILYKITDNALPKEHIDELIHRFNLSAYSYEFWHTTNIIKEFVPVAKDAQKMHYHNWYSIKDNNRFGIISDDKKSVVLLKRVKHRDCSYDNYGYGLKDKDYKFINLTNEAIVTKISDTGKIKDDSWWAAKMNNYDDLYPAKEKTPKENIVYLNSNEHPSKVYYITNDGYISGSLTDMLYDNLLSYVSDMPVIYTITLPTKITQ